MKKETKLETSKKEKNKKVSKKTTFSEIFGEVSSKICKVDFIIMGILVVIYSLFAFHDLGTMQTPKTYYKFNYVGEDVGIQLKEGSKAVSKIRYYTGPETGDFTILTSVDGKTYENVMDFSTLSVFAWEDLTLDKEFKYIKFKSNTLGSYLGDVQLYDSVGQKVLVEASDEQSKVIVDELETVPVQISHINSAYFDEIYFARTAYEYTHGIDAIEWTHPPLGKLLMAIPVLLFGMSTFSYRLMGAIAGVLMIPVIYILAKRLFKNRKWALLAGTLMACDTFHFAQTRMGTVDSFLVLFILLSVLFMKDYIDLDEKASFKLKVRKLLLSGLFIGCAIATKWTGLYALLGLAIVFFAHLFKANEDGRKTKINYNRASKMALAGLVVLSFVPIVLYYAITILDNSTHATSCVFWYYFSVCLLSLIAMVIALVKKDKSLRKTFLVCIVAFIVIPAIIYVLSYMLFPHVYGYTTNSISGIVDQIKSMYNYHSTLTESHPFTSDWYQWPIMYKPVWYYVGYFGGNVKSTIVGIGNPAIWWFGIVAFIYALVKTISKREKELFFILMFILCTFVPYIFIGRAMFMYHYFPTLPFVMLAIVAFVKWITEKIKNNSFYVFYMAVVVVLFLIFYPVASGMTTTTDYIDSIKWLSSWIF